MKLSGEFNGNQVESQKKKKSKPSFSSSCSLTIFHRILYLREAAGCCLYTFIRLLLSWL